MEIGLRGLGLFGKLLSLLWWPIIFVRSRLKKTALPPIKNEILLMSATKLAEKIRTRELSSEEVVMTFIDRCKTVNPILNAIVEDRFDDALMDAQDVDRRIASGEMLYEEMKRDTPLLGVPFTVKESCKVKGMSWSVGSLSRRNIVAQEDGEAVARLRQAGGIPIAVTNTPELCASWETVNLITGRTSNPYNQYRTCGGSSGGEASLLGAAASVIGVGSDFAGSIRVPSMFCGIFGHKPSGDSIPVEGHFPYSEDLKRFMSVGPMARYAEDLLLLFSIMVGDKARDLKMDVKPDISTLDILYKADAGFSLVAVPVDKEIRRLMYDVLQHLRETYKCRIIKAQMEELADSVEMCSSVFLGLKGIQNFFSYNIPDNELNIFTLLAELIKSVFGCSTVSTEGVGFVIVRKFNAFIPKNKHPHYCEQVEELKSKFIKALGKDAVFLYPTFPIPAFHHGEYMTKSAGIVYTMICNALQLPSTHVPLGLHSNGLPIGIQVIAAPGQDRLCLAVAQALEKHFGGWVVPPCKKS